MGFLSVNMIIGQLKEENAGRCTRGLNIVGGKRHKTGDKSWEMCLYSAFLTYYWDNQEVMSCPLWELSTSVYPLHLLSVIYLGGKNLGLYHQWREVRKHVSDTNY